MSELTVEEKRELKNARERENWRNVERQLRYGLIIKK